MTPRTIPADVWRVLCRQYYRELVVAYAAYRARRAYSGHWPEIERMRAKP